MKREYGAGLEEHNQAKQHRDKTFADSNLGKEKAKCDPEKAARVAAQANEEETKCEYGAGSEEHNQAKRHCDKTFTDSRMGKDKARYDSQKAARAAAQANEEETKREYGAGSEEHNQAKRLLDKTFADSRVGKNKARYNAKKAVYAAAQTNEEETKRCRVSR